MDPEDERRIRRLQENLSAIRKTAGWTADKLGQELDISRQSISALENGRTVMTKIHYLAIRAVFDNEVARSQNRKLAYVLRALVDDPADELEPHDEDRCCGEGELANIVAAFESDLIAVNR